MNFIIKMMIFLFYTPKAVWKNLRGDEVEQFGSKKIYIDNRHNIWESHKNRHQYIGMKNITGTNVV